MNSFFQFIRPDEVAECWNGVTPALYKTLWDCPPPSGPKPEEPYPEYGALADHWDRFTPEEQAELNRLAEENC